MFFMHWSLILAEYEHHMTMQLRFPSDSKFMWGGHVVRFSFFGNSDFSKQNLYGWNMSFFCISSTQDKAGKFCFRDTRHTSITKAVRTKADRVNSTAELQNLQAADTVAFEVQTATDTRDLSKEPGREATCKLSSSFARSATGVPELDGGESIC